MTKEERQKAIDALKISVPVRAATQEEFNDYIQILNKVMDWLEQESCEDAVSREAAKKLYCNICMDKNICYRDKEHCQELNLFDNLPPVTPKPKTGKIIMGGYDCDHYLCSECSYDFGWFSKPDYNYCPNCGAKMEGE